LDIFLDNKKGVKMDDIMSAMKGKKTYLLAIVAVGSLVCEMMNFAKMPEGWYEMLGFGSFVTIRHGMKK
tara:strand:- start:14520 stop:14726 length:207 start_codon:yes stop_codon:yes gene_type:complete